MLGAVVVIGCAGLSARAADDDDDALPDTKFFRSVLHALGLRRDGDGIDYRERSPLVLPPNAASNLPPPETDNPAKKDTAWPVDPDVKRGQGVEGGAQEARTYDSGDNVEENPLRPDESNLPKPASPSSRPDGKPGDTADAAARPSSTCELGSKSVFSGGSFWGSKEEYVDIHRRAAARQPDRSAARIPHAIAQPALRCRQTDLEADGRGPERTRKIGESSARNHAILACRDSRAAREALPQNDMA